MASQSVMATMGVPGVKMLATDFFKSLLGQHFNFYLLGIVLLILAAGVVASLLHRPKAGSSAEHGVHGQPSPTPLP